MLPRPHPERQRRLEAARLAGAGLLALLAQLTVDMPKGKYFGVAEEITSWGWAYSIAVVVLTVLGVWSRLGRRGFAAFLIPATYILHIGVFTVPVAYDPVIAGGVVLWNMLLLSRWTFPTHSSRRREPLADPLRAWLAVNEPAVRHLLLISLTISTVVVGYRLGTAIPTLVLCMTVDAVVVALTAPFLLRLWRLGHRSRVLVLVALAMLALMLLGIQPLWALAALAAYQLAVAVQMLVRGPSFHELVENFYGQPALLVLASFALLITGGTLLLSFPAASATSEAISPIDALFTATSAACVTGLIVLDTPVAFSTFGHGVILGLIQVGGLSIMVLSTFAAILLGRGLSLRGERALGALLDLGPHSSAYPLIRFIVISTLAIEAVGAVILTGVYLSRGEGIAAAVWKGTFHSISAFCNAGFALHSDSLIGFQGNSLALGTIAVLIIMGGLGFVVLAATRFLVYKRHTRITVHTKLVLVSTVVLIVVGTFGYAWSEWQRSLDGLGLFDKWMNAFFQSVTLRTAGFNSVDLARLHSTSVVMMVVWMFIGASPGGTGGGIKTTTAAVLLSIIPAIASGRPQVVLFGRRIALETIYKSAAIVLISTVIALVATMLLLATQQPLESEVVLFEVVSALGTVGLTLGATFKLDNLGKIVIAVVMLLGRIGPLSLALLLARREESELRYPEARVMVG